MNPGRVKITLYLLLFLWLLIGVAQAKTGGLNPSGEPPYKYEKVSFDTLYINNTADGAAFREVFVEIDSLVRVSKIKAYYSYMLRKQYNNAEAKRLGWSMEVFQVLIDKNKPGSGT